jgi:plant G-box-binding factor
MASSTSATSGGDECPRAPTSDASAAAGTAPLTLPQAHVEWAASMQAYYAAGGQPYAWHTAQVRASSFCARARSRLGNVVRDLNLIRVLVHCGGGMQQHLMAAAAAAAGAPYGTPVPFHPAYYATHASMATVNAGHPPSIVSFSVCTPLFSV